MLLHVVAVQPSHFSASGFVGLSRCGWVSRAYSCWSLFSRSLSSDRFLDLCLSIFLLSMDHWCVHIHSSIVLGWGGTPKVTDYNYLADPWQQLLNTPAKWWCLCSWGNRFHLLIVLLEHSMLRCPHNFQSQFGLSKTESIFLVTDLIIFKNKTMFSWMFLVSILWSFFLLDIISSPFSLRI